MTQRKNGRYVAVETDDGRTVKMRRSTVRRRVEKKGEESTVILNERDED